MSDKFLALRSLIEVDQSKGVLIAAYKELKRSRNLGREGKRLLAEICFLIARLYKKEGNKISRKFGKESIELFRYLGIRSKEKAIPLLRCLHVDYVHEGVVEAEIFGKTK